MIPEAKIQSTGQAGPEINRDLEVLFERLNEASRTVNTLKETVDALSGGSTGSPSPSDPPVPEDSGSSSKPVTDATATVLAGTGEAEDDEDAWTTVSAGVPSGALVLVQGRMWSSNDDAGGSVEVRTENGAQEITLAVVRADGTSDADRESIGWYPLPTTSAGTIQYRANTTSGSTTWKLNKLGSW